MRDLELKIKPSDWLKIIALAILFSTLLTLLIYLLLSLPLRDGIVAGLVLGIFLGVLSFASIHVTNNFLIKKIPPKYSPLWWASACIASILAGFLGFYISYNVLTTLGVRIPDAVKGSVLLISLMVGLLNYLVGLLLFFFIDMRNRKETLLRKTAELRNLASLRMVESHFLSNTLNNIIELIHSDPDKAEEALIMLTRYLRVILNERDLITLKDELELVESYIALQRIRFKNLIDLQRTIADPSLLLIKIPKFTLQLLVENAIAHGFTGDPLTIKIRAFFLNSKAIVEVENNGEPIKILSLGHGLKLLSERLALHLDGKLKLLSKAPVVFQIILPKTKDSRSEVFHLNNTQGLYEKRG